MAKRINRCIELLAQDQAIYYDGPHSGSVLTHAQGRIDAATWADYMNVGMEHGSFDMAGLAEYMRGLVDGGPTKSGHRTPTVVVEAPVNGIDEENIRYNAWQFRQILGRGVHGILLCQAETPSACEMSLTRQRALLCLGSRQQTAICLDASRHPLMKNETGPAIGRLTAMGAPPLRTTSLMPPSGSICRQTSICWTPLSVCGAGLAMILIATIPGFASSSAERSPTMSSAGSFSLRRFFTVHVSPTSAWKPGQYYQDIRDLRLPADLPDGVYSLVVTVYQWWDNTRLLPAQNSLWTLTGSDSSYLVIQRINVVS